jgi:[methyl-Co(III) methanol-specific corrinoid protein]:coenzyme M methyltransferase
MKTRERVIAALQKQKVDRIPVVGVSTAVTLELMDKSKVSWPEAHHNANLMVDLAAAAYDYCGIETMKLPFDMTVEAELLGMSIVYGDRKTLPKVRGDVCKDLESFEFNPADLQSGRVLTVLKAIEIARIRR